jgi:hypothetical protein
MSWPRGHLNFVCDFLPYVDVKSVLLPQTGQGELSYTSLIIILGPEGPCNLCSCGSLN